MNDTFIERLIKRKISTLGIVLRISFVVAIFACVIIFLQYGSIGFILEVIVSYTAFYIFKYTSIEYEYCYVTGEFIIDKVMGKAKRKKCIKVDMSTLELVAPVGHESVNEYNNSKVVFKKFSSGYNPDKEYVMFYRKDADLVKITFEPDEEIVKAMQMIAPRKVYI